MNSQPIQIIAHIIKYLDWPNQVKCRPVSKIFRTIIDSELISGTKPKNIYEMILTDNIYYYGEFQPQLLSSTTDITIPFFPDVSPGSVTYLFIFKFFLVKYMPFSKFNKFILNKDILTLKINNYTNYIIYRIVSTGDLELLKKLIPIINLNDDNKICILLCASIFGHLHIIKYLVDNNLAIGIGKELIRCTTIHDHLDIFEYVCETWFDLTDHNIFFYILDESIFNKNIRCSKFLLDLDKINISDQEIINFFSHKIFIGNAFEVEIMLNLKPSLVNLFITHQHVINNLIKLRKYDIVTVLKKYGIYINKPRYILSKSLNYIFQNTRSLMFADQVINLISSTPVNMHDDVRPLLFVQIIFATGSVISKNKYICLGLYVVHFFGCLHMLI